MKRLLLLTLLFFVGCDLTIEIPGMVPPEAPAVQYPAYKIPFPTISLEEVFRKRNWVGSEDEGSCVHATMIMLFRWQGRHDLADAWKYENGEYAERLAVRFDKEGVRYAYTSLKKDVRFLEWACQTRRGCGVTVMGGKHMVMLVHLDRKWAGLLDNNQTDKIKWVARETFLSEWFNSNSWAVTPVYTPPAPQPFS